jgi:hypothetical protein
VALNTIPPYFFLKDNDYVREETRVPGRKRWDKFILILLLLTNRRKKNIYKR